AIHCIILVSITQLNAPVKRVFCFAEQNQGVTNEAKRASVTGYKKQRWHGAISAFLLFPNVPFTAAPSQKFPVNGIRSVPNKHRLFFGSTIGTNLFVRDFIWQSGL
ncbi:MAG: hypothetical protein ACI3XD_03720, partial [Oscillospiraceae bacterium]